MCVDQKVAALKVTVQVLYSYYNALVFMGYACVDEEKMVALKVAVEVLYFKRAFWDDVMCADEEKAAAVRCMVQVVYS